MNNELLQIIVKLFFKLSSARSLYDAREKVCTIIFKQESARS